MAPRKNKTLGLDIPTIEEFDTKSLDPKGQYIVISNYYFEDTKDGQAMDSGVDDVDFFNKVQEFASGHGEEIVMADAHTIYMSGDFSLSDSLKEECGGLFDYDYSDFDGIIEHHYYELEAKEEDISVVPCVQ